MEEKGTRARGQTDPRCCKGLAHIICSPWRRLSAFLAKGNIAEMKMEVRWLRCCLGTNSPSYPCKESWKTKWLSAGTPNENWCDGARFGSWPIAIVILVPARKRKAYGKCSFKLDGCRRRVFTKQGSLDKGLGLYKGEVRHRPYSRHQLQDRAKTPEDWI